jgi:hypothetical protein
MPVSSAVYGIELTNINLTPSIKPPVPWPGRQMGSCAVFEGSSAVAFADQEIHMVRLEKGDIILNGRVFWEYAVANLTATVGIVPVNSAATGAVTNCSLFTGTLNLAAANTTGSTCGLFNMTACGWPVPVQSDIVIRTNNVSMGSGVSKIVLAAEFLRPGA